MLMDTIHFIRILNLILAVASFPPSVFLLIKTSREGKMLTGATLSVNKVLRFMFTTFSLATITNAFISILSITNTETEFFLGQQFQATVNFRDLIVNTGFLCVSIALVVISIYDNKHKK